MERADLATMRTEYATAGLDEHSAGDDPLALLERWLADAVAAGVHEPNAMAVATSTPDGRPSVRIVLLKGLDERGAVFYTNYTSRKGTELETNPRAAAVTLWHSLERQVRIEGPVTRLSDEESDANFGSRPLGSRLGAVASPQSQVLDGREELERRLAEAERTAGPDGPTRPATWGGYRVALESVEFWQGRPSRLHDRIRFLRDGERWRRERLAP